MMRYGGPMKILLAIAELADLEKIRQLSQTSSETGH
jgi:hypothetical protein